MRYFYLTCLLLLVGCISTSTPSDSDKVVADFSQALYENRQDDAIALFSEETQEKYTDFLESLDREAKAELASVLDSLTKTQETEDAALYAGTWTKDEQTYPLALTTYREPNGMWKIVDID